MKTRGHGRRTAGMVGRGEGSGGRVSTTSAGSVMSPDARHRPDEPAGRATSHSAWTARRTAGPRRNGWRRRSPASPALRPGRAGAPLSSPRALSFLYCNNTGLAILRPLCAGFGGIARKVTHDGPIKGKTAMTNRDTRGPAGVQPGSCHGATEPLGRATTEHTPGGDAAVMSPRIVRPAALPSGHLAAFRADSVSNRLVRRHPGEHR